MDDISQVVELEYKGTYYLLKGTKDFLAYALKTIKALHEWRQDRKIKKPGESSWQKLQAASDNGAVILEFPEEMFRKDENGKIPFNQYVKKNKLRYCIMPDFNTEDGFIPVGVVSQDVALHQRHINEFVDLRIVNAKIKDESYDEKIARLTEKVANARTPKDKKKAEAALEAAKQAKKENQGSIKEAESKKENGYVLSFEEYLKQGEKAGFKEDPEAVLRREDICGSVMEYTPYDCMYPIRDKDKVPESKKVFYSQRTVDDDFYTIRREFVEDEHGLIFSNYFVTNAKNAGEVKTFSDKGFTKEQWRDQLKEVLKDSGMLPTVKTATFHTEDRLKSYMIAVESNFFEASDLASKAKGIEPSSEEAKNLIESAKSEKAVKEGYENIGKRTFVVSGDNITLSEAGLLSVITEEGIIEGIRTGEYDADNVEVEIRTDKEYMLEKPDGKREKISGADALESLGGTKKDVAIQTTSKVAGRK